MKLQNLINDLKSKGFNYALHEGTEYDIQQLLDFFKILGSTSIAFKEYYEYCLVNINYNYGANTISKHASSIG
jgi:hypothetical protein